MSTTPVSARTIRRTTLAEIREDARLVDILVELTAPRGVLRGWLGKGWLASETAPALSWVVIMTEESTVVGWAVAVPVWPGDERALLGWFVRPECRGRGIARALTKSLLATLPATVREVEVASGNAAVTALMCPHRLIDPGCVEYNPAHRMNLTVRYARYQLRHHTVREPTSE